jgi:hypothetical protein
VSFQAVCPQLLREIHDYTHLPALADPREFERVQDIRDTIKTPTRAEGCGELHTWLQDQISLGQITDAELWSVPSQTRATTRLASEKPS